MIISQSFIADGHYITTQAAKMKTPGEYADLLSPPLIVSANNSVVQVI